MKTGLPIALVTGAEHFAAKQLIEEIIRKDINVLAVGENVWDWGENEQLESRMEIEEVSEDLDYVFDFSGDEKAWDKAGENEAKLTVISVNEGKKVEELIGRLENRNENWRLIAAYGVYGPGMEEDNFLSRAIRLSVENKNLILPASHIPLRILAVNDLVEAVLRASFLSGTERERFLVVGKEITSEEIAEVLVNEGKMTRFKVIQSETRMEEWNKEIVEENWRKLRWEPTIEFKKGIKETLQYFFTKIDEENRRKVKNQKSKIESQKSKIESQKSKREEVKRIWEVEVEEEKEELVEAVKKTPVQTVEVEEIKKEPEVEVEDPWEEEKITLPAPPKEEKYIEDKMKEENVEEKVVGKEVEAFEEIKPILIKNSNMRPVAGEEIVEKVKIEMPKIEEEIKEVKPILPFMEQKKEESVKMPETGIKPVKIRKINWKWFAGGVGLGVLVLLSGPTWWGIKSYGVVKNLQKAATLTEAKKYDEAGKLTDKAMKDMEGMNLTINEWGLNQIGLVRSFQEGLKVGMEVAGVEKKAGILAKDSDGVYEAIFKDKKIDWGKETKTIKSDMEEVERDLGNLQGRLSGDLSFVPPRWKPMALKANQKVSDYRKLLISAKEMVDILPELIGTEGGERKYMVLLQNESEIRPTGGFIGSYGILTFKGGKLTDFVINDIYEADGQLKGHVEPPEELKTYLGEASWFMRDANWQVNFGSAAKDIQWFLDKETGMKVDGVIGVDLAVARAFLGVIGEVKLPDFKETITKDNLYEQAEFYAETKFFPGSNQKASFLGGLGRQLFEEIKNLKNEKKLKLLEATIEMLNGNEIQIALNNKQGAKSIGEMGWDGNMYEGKCGTQRCFADYLYLVEANLGVNKANYFLLRNIEQSVDIGRNTVGRVVKINYENTSKSKDWPGGDYKNYMRVYVPASVNIASISAINSDDPNSRRIYNPDELKIKNVGNKKEIGFLVTVPIGKRITIEMRYSNSVNLAGSNEFSYLNYIQKQPGYGDTGIVTLVSFPNDWQPVQVQPAASVVGGKILFNQKLTEDIKMGVEIGK